MRYLNRLKQVKKTGYLTIHFLILGLEALAKGHFDLNVPRTVG
jgi:hypothetical protein